MAIEGASLMSSVPGLKASPHTATVFHFRSGMCFKSFSTGISFCLSLTLMVAERSGGSTPAVFSVCIKA